MIRAELQKYSNSIHIMLSEDQKMRILAITDELGSLETEKLTGVSEQNIYRWRRKGCIRKKGSGRPVTYPHFEKKLVGYILDLREKGIPLSCKRFLIYVRKNAEEDNLEDN